MKTLNVNILTIIIANIFFVSCKKDEICIEGEGLIITKTITVPDFTRINLKGAANVFISQGSTQLVSAKGHENIIDKLEKNVSGNIWTIELESGCYGSYELTIYITVPDINNISISGSGNIEVGNFSNQAYLSASISGSGNIDFDDFNGIYDLLIDISGSGNITVNNELLDLKFMEIDISGVGNFNGYPIQTNECEISISGVGNCYVYVIEMLDVSISGVGNVYYKGNPMNISSITGSGSLIHIN